MAKNKNKNSVPEREDKMVKPKQAVRSFNFPSFNTTVQASSVDEAQELLVQKLKSKSKQND